MDILLDHTWIFTPEQARTNVIVPFTVPRAYDRLQFDFVYGPKAIHDPEIILQKMTECMEKYVPPEERPPVIRVGDYDAPVNFVTLSVDCGDEYIGCAHRHPSKQTIVIGEKEASFGFFAHPITAGDWRVVLNIHAVVAGTVNYHLVITGKEAGEA